MHHSPTYTDQLPGRTLTVEGVEYRYFSGTSYLGMACNAQFQGLVQEGMMRYGTNFSSSRRSNLQLQVYKQTEEYLANLTGAEAALTFSSGMLAGQVLVQALRRQGRFFYAPCAHPALWLSDDVAEQANSPLSFKEWVATLPSHVLQAKEREVILVCNALDPLQAKAYTFEWVADLPKEKTYTLVVDDSHGFGVCGAEGAGIYPQLQKYRQQVRLVVVSSFGKALGIPAGFILGDKYLVNQLQASPFFGGASPAIPAYLHAYLQAGELFTAARTKLSGNIRLFLERLQRPGLFRFIKDYPVFSTSHSSLYTYLQERRMLISCFRYPTAESLPVTRVILSSLHTQEDIVGLADALSGFAPAEALNSPVKELSKEE